MNYTFTEDQAKAAADAWGCNCGPTALAFAVRADLESVRHAIPDFDSKRYTSPTMMKAALERLGVAWEPIELFKRWPREKSMMWVEECMSVQAVWRQVFTGRPTLMRVQWTGPWTAPGANPKWAYRMTHWIACFADPSAAGEAGYRVFDVNGGIRPFHDWITTIVPILTGLYPRADGGWLPTHAWRITAP